MNITDRKGKWWGAVVRKRSAKRRSLLESSDTPQVVGLKHASSLTLPSPISKREGDSIDVAGELGLYGLSMVALSTQSGSFVLPSERLCQY